jgi:predicted DNA-binding protein (MmcQ/YjbR family)
MKKSANFETIKNQLREHALQYPDVTEDFPWGELAIKIKTKAFIFMRAEEEVLSLSVKLPHSRDMAVDLPFAQPTGYGLGKHGWVTAKFVKGDEVPVDLLKSWIDESFRAVAPKRVVASLDAKK